MTTKHYTSGAAKRKRRDNNSPCNINNGAKIKRYDPLACWLWNLTIDLPDQSISQGIVTLVRRKTRAEVVVVVVVVDSHLSLSDSNAVRFYSPPLFSSRFARTAANK